MWSICILPCLCVSPVATCSGGPQGCGVQVWWHPGKWCRTAQGAWAYRGAWKAVSSCAFVTSLLDLKQVFLLEVVLLRLLVFHCSSDELTYQCGAMASRGIREELDELRLSRHNLRAEVLAVLGTIWTISLLPCEKWSQLAWGQLKSYVLPRYVV